MFCLFASTGTSDATFTQLALSVDDIDAEVAELRGCGVEFEVFDIPGMPMVDGIVEVEGNYPSKGTGERGAWFRDSEGNLIGIGQSLPGKPRQKTGQETGPKTDTATLRGTSILLGSADPDRLRAFYRQVFDLGPADEGWLSIGGIGLLADERADVANRNPERGRVVLTFEADDLAPFVARLRDLGVRWSANPNSAPTAGSALSRIPTATSSRSSG